MDDLIQQLRHGRPRAIARLITLVENSADASEKIVTQLYVHTGQAHLIGVTGPPGSGKSTLVNALAKTFRQHDHRVGIIAVDPSSPFTGGALLGDRVRMRDLAGDKGIFIRSMASRGNLGGLSQATSAAIKVLDAAGFETILVETVGAGQAEVDIAAAAHTTLVIEAPGMGDDIQSIKAGILEIADLLVVNKADRPGAAGTVRSLNSMLQLGRSVRLNHHGRPMQSLAAAEVGDKVQSGWQVPVLETIATDGTGIDSLTDTIFSHKTYLQTTGEWQERERQRSRKEIEQLLQNRLMAHLRAVVPQTDCEQLVLDVAARKIDPYAAVAQLLQQISL